MSTARKKRRAWVIAAAVIVVLAVAAGIVLSPDDPLRSSARRQWASQAIATIGQRVDDKAWLAKELAKVKSAPAVEPFQTNWVSDELLVARNGEWLICQNICAKDQNKAVGKDILIGHGSDGRWYYSTFHFCVGKCVLQMESQPATLAQAVDGYWMVPFDGNPENCLKET